MTRTSINSIPKVFAGTTIHRAFDHILIIMLENEYRQYVLQNPYMRRLARQGLSSETSTVSCTRPKRITSHRSQASCATNPDLDNQPARTVSCSISLWRARAHGVDFTVYRSWDDCAASWIYPI